MDIQQTTRNLLQVLRYYIESRPPSTKVYEKGLMEISKVLQNALSKIESIYYRYILRPELHYHLTIPNTPIDVPRSIA